MPTIIGQQDNTLPDTLNALFSIPAQMQQNKVRQAQAAQEQQKFDSGLAVDQSRIASNNSTAGYNRQRTLASQNQQAALGSQDLSAALSSLFTPGADGRVNPQGLEAILGANPKQGMADIAKLFTAVTQGNMQGQVGAVQDVNTPTGQANLAAMGAGKGLPSAYSGNANGLVTNEITGQQQAPSASVQQALLEQDAAGRSKSKPVKAKPLLDVGKILMENYLKSPTENEFGEISNVFDSEKMAQYQQFVAANEASGKSEAEVAQAFMNAMDQNSAQQKSREQALAEYEALSPGDQYLDPNGVLRTKS